MHNLLGNGRTLMRNPGMALPAIRWYAARLCGRTPRHAIAPNVRIGEWINFSEYLHYTTEDEIRVSEKRLIRRCLEGGSQRIVFDLGANVGLFTCYTAGAGARAVHSFEPIPETFCRLRQNVIKNQLASLCRLNCLAAGSSDGLVKFLIDPRSPGANHVLPEGPSDLPQGNLVQSVATVTLDRYCEIEKIEQIDFMKIDVEGMEPSVLEGGRRLFAEKRVGCVLMELNPHTLRVAGSSVKELAELVSALGYSIRSLNPEGQPGPRPSLEQLEAVTSDNFLLVPAGA